MSERDDNKRLSEAESKALVREFFHLFAALRRPKRDHQEHPSKSQLRAYLRGALPDLWVRPLLERRLQSEHRSQPIWTKSTVSLHVATCAHCAGWVEQMRQRENGPGWLEESLCAFGITGKRGRRWVLACTVSMAVLIALMLNFSRVPVNTIESPPPVVDIIQRDGGRGML